MRTVKEAKLNGKRVLVRVDFNVPLNKGKISDDKRIRAALPTINFLRKNKAKVILISHLGRPHGKIVEELRLQPIAERLSKIVGYPVHYEPDCIGSEVENAIRSLHEGDILLLENLRFYPEEEKNDTLFASKLAAIADIYVNDAFAACHRAHASVEAITRFLPSYAGFLLEKEIRMLSRLTRRPKKPFVAIMGGAKVSDKIGAIENLIKKVDALLICGAMAFTFLQANGSEIGKSKSETDKVELAKKLLRKHGKKIILPVDIILDNKKTVPADGIPDKAAGLDIGPKTIKLFGQKIRKAKTVFWNGPAGMFEKKPFHKGTLAIAKAIAGSKATSILGGGETEEAIQRFKLSTKFTHISTGGGASLEFLEGKTLPGIKALD